MAKVWIKKRVGRIPFAWRLRKNGQDRLLVALAPVTKKSSVPLSPNKNAACHAVTDK